MNGVDDQTPSEEYPVQPPPPAPPPNPYAAGPNADAPSAAAAAAVWGNASRPAASVAPVPGLVDEAGLVVADVPCRRCSYNLRGMHLGARCPECGAPVVVAVHGPLLRYGDPGWVHNLARGASFYFWGIIVKIVVGFLAGFVVLALGPWVAPFVGLVAGIVSLYGAWLLTEPDPSGIGEGQYGTARQIIRVTFVIGIVNTVLSPVVQQAGTTSPSLALTLGIVSLLAGLASVVGNFAMLRYLERLAHRIPDLDYAARARFLFWAYGSTLAVVVVLGGVVAIAGIFAASGGGRPGGGAAGVIFGFVCMMGLAGIVLLVFFVMFLILLYRLQVAFGQQADYARYAWATVERA